MVHEPVPGQLGKDHPLKFVWDKIVLDNITVDPDVYLLVVRSLKELDATTIIVVLTGYASIATAVESIKLGATTYLMKSCRKVVDACPWQRRPTRR